MARRLKEGEWRNPKEDELRMLEFLLAGLPRDFEPYRAQIKGAQVRLSCDCGCPTVELRPPEDATLGRHDYEVIGDVLLEYNDGAHCGAILFVKNGKISELEVYGGDRLPGLEARVAKIEYDQNHKFDGRETESRE